MARFYEGRTHRAGLSGLENIYGRASTVDEQYVKVIRDEEVALPSSTPLASKLGKLAALASRVKKAVLNHL